MITLKQCYSTTDGQEFASADKAKAHELELLINRGIPACNNSAEIATFLMDNEKEIVSILKERLGKISPKVKSKPIRLTKPILPTIENFDKMFSKSRRTKRSIEEGRKFIVRYIAFEKFDKWDVMVLDGGSDGAVCQVVREFIEACGDTIHKQNRKKGCKESRSFYRRSAVVPTTPDLFASPSNIKFTNGNSFSLFSTDSQESPALISFINEKIFNVMSIKPTFCDHRELIYSTMAKMTDTEPKIKVATVKKCIAKLVSDKKLMSIPTGRMWAYYLPTAPPVPQSAVTTQ